MWGHGSICYYVCSQDQLPWHCLGPCAGACIFEQPVIAPRSLGCQAIRLLWYASGLPICHSEGFSKHLPDHMRLYLHAVRHVWSTQTFNEGLLARYYRAACFGRPSGSHKLPIVVGRSLMLRNISWPPKLRMSPHEPPENRVCNSATGTLGFGV